MSSGSISQAGNLIMPNLSCLNPLIPSSILPLLVCQEDSDSSINGRWEAMDGAPNYHRKKKWWVVLALILGGVVLVVVVVTTRQQQRHHAQVSPTTVRQSSLPSNLTTTSTTTLTPVGQANNALGVAPGTPPPPITTTAAHVRPQTASPPSDKQAVEEGGPDPITITDVLGLGDDVDVLGIDTLMPGVGEAIDLQEDAMDPTSIISIAAGDIPPSPTAVAAAIAAYGKNMTCVVHDYHDLREAIMMKTCPMVILAATDYNITYEIIGSRRVTLMGLTLSTLVKSNADQHTVVSVSITTQRDISP